jgi:hypothetical protein
MGLVIGFATEFYTLWDVQIEPMYKTDAYGQHWHVSNKTNFNYIKNVSHDLEKAKSLHPGVPVDDSLRGKTRSFSMGGNGIELSPVNILWFGKYFGQDVCQLVKTDFQYVLWLLENAHDFKLRHFISELPEVIAYQADKKQKDQMKMDSINKITDSGVWDLTVTTNPTEGDGVFNMYATLGPDHKVCLLLTEENVTFIPGNYRYPDYYAFSTGCKVKRIKNKSVKINLELLNTHFDNGMVIQKAIFKGLINGK